jgi:F420-dependent oxidoreductase-like protein
MDISIMIEGQDGLTWSKWQRLARAVEDLGFAGLFRSDHYTNPSPPDKPSLELWVSLTWLASHTERIAFGPLVTPASFRHPSMTARMAAGVDDLSRGRLRLGLGAGWQEREHRMFGRALLDVGPRFDRYREYLEVVTRLLQSDDPVSFEGEYYTLREAILLPRPQRPGGPPITVGGNGRKRTLPLAAEFADEWNAVYCTPARWTDLNARLDRLLATQGRDPDEVRRTMMTGIVFGEDESALRARLASRGQSAQEARENGAIVGTPGAVRDQLGALMDAGLDGVMLQWLDLDDVDGLASFSQAVI